MPTFRGYSRLLQLGGIEREITPVPGYISKEQLQEEIDGIKAKLVTQYDNVFYMGAGSGYASVFNSTHMIPVTESMETSADVTCENGDKIILVIAGTFRDYFHRADMNGIEIQFTETAQTIGDAEYKVLTSVNTYQAGTYNIDINR